MARLRIPPAAGWIVLLAALWGASFPAISVALQHATPMLLAAVRFDVAGAIMLAIVALVYGRDALPRGRRAWLAIGIAGTLFIGSYHAFLFWGQARTTSTIAVVLVALNPVFTTAAGRFARSDDRLGPQGLLGLGLGVLGVAVLVGLKPGDLLDARGLGELAVVLAVLSWSVCAVIVRGIRHGLKPPVLAAWQAAAGALVLHVLAFGLEGGGAIAWTRDLWLSLGYMALVASVAGLFIYFRLLERVGPVRVNLVSFLAPLFAGAAGLLAFGTPIEARAVFAFVLITAGFGLVLSGASPAAAPRSA